MTKRLPDWIKQEYSKENLRGMKKFLRGHRLATVCEEARCPNKGKCFSKPTATFLVLGDKCTRSCTFCSVTKTAPMPPDTDEPRRVAEATREMELTYVVITSPTRDDLPDGGASHFAETIGAVRELSPGVKIEVLTPDFQGSIDALKKVVNAGPDVLNHNMETVPRLYPKVRPQANYQRSLEFLREAKKLGPESMRTKSGLMVGLGETLDEVREVMRDLRGVGCDFLTIGQYLRPRRENIEVSEYIHPEKFDILKGEALDMGFKHVASSPLVRSSMNAEEVYEHVKP